MGVDQIDFDAVEGVSPSFVEGLYHRYAGDAGSVDPSWQRYFEGLEQAVQGPSWARANWPSTDWVRAMAWRRKSSMAAEDFAWPVWDPVSP